EEERAVDVGQIRGIGASRAGADVLDEVSAGGRAVRHPKFGAVVVVGIDEERGGTDGRQLDRVRTWGGVEVLEQMRRRGQESAVLQALQSGTASGESRSVVHAAGERREQAEQVKAHRRYS